MIYKTKNLFNLSDIQKLLKFITQNKSKQKFFYLITIFKKFVFINCRFVQMGCYGLGVSRIVAALTEVHSDPYGIRWPLSIAP